MINNPLHKVLKKMAPLAEFDIFLFFLVNFIFSFLEKLVLLTNRGLCKRGCYKINLINFSLLAIANPKSLSLPTLKLLRFRNKGSKVGAETIPLKLYELPLLLHSLKRKEIVALLLWECLTTFLQPSWDF